MPVAKGAQLEFWRHLLSLNGIDWESEQVSFSDDDECYTCMPKMAWLSDSCTTPSQARHWLASEFSNLHQTYPDNIEQHEEFKSGGAWGVLMLVMSMIYMQKQSTWKKRESMASLDGIFKRSSGSSTRNNSIGPSTPSPRRMALKDEEPTLISIPGFRQRPNRRSITLSTPLITASNIHTASQRQLSPISPSPSTPTDTTNTLKPWTAGTAKNGYDAKLNPDLADFITKPLSESPNDFFDFDPPLSSPEPSPPSPISPSSSQYAYPAFPRNVRTVTFFPEDNNDNRRTVSGVHTHSYGHIRSRSAPTIPASFVSNPPTVINNKMSLTAVPGPTVTDLPIPTQEVANPPLATGTQTADLPLATQRRMRRDQPMYGGEFVRYLGAIERPDTPPTPPLDLDVDVEAMESEGGGPSSTFELPEIPPQEQMQDSRPEERQSAGLVSRLPVVIQKLWSRLRRLRDTVCTRGGGVVLNARRKSRVAGPQMSETEKVHVQ